MSSTMSVSPTSIAGMVQQVRRLLSQALTDELVMTTAAYTPGSGTVRLRSGSKRLGPGSILSWREASLYAVGAANAVDGSVEVISGYDGGADVPIPQGTPMRLNPRFSDLTIFDMLATQIAALSSPQHMLYGVASERFSGMTVDDYYSIPATATGPAANTVLKVLRVLSKQSWRDWVRNDSFVVSMTPGEEHIRIFDNSIKHEVTYAVKFSRPTSFLDDAVTVCGMPESMIDIPPLGVAGVLMAGQEARRVHQKAQGDPRRSEDVPITGATGAARDLRRLFAERVDEEYARLVQQTGYSYRGSL